MFFETRTRMPAGSYVWRKEPWYDHMAVCLGDDLIYENAKGIGPRIIPLAQFEGGRSLEYQETGLPIGPMWQRANLLVQSGSAYDLMNHNCEDSAYWVATGEAQSPQRNGWIAAGLLGVVAIILVAGFRNDSDRS